MPTQTHGHIPLFIIFLTFCINVLFGVLIARATYRAMTQGDTSQYLRVVLLNDSLERIRSAILTEVISWGSV